MTRKQGAVNRRRIYFIKKDFQIRFILKFCLLVAFGAIISTLALYFFSRGTLTASFEGSRLSIQETARVILPAILCTNLFTLLLIAVATIAVTLLVSHKVAGPLYRIEQDLREIGGGNLNLQIHLRRKDQLKELAARINEMVQGIQGKALRVQGQAQEMLPLILECELSQERGCREKAEQLSAAFVAAFRLESPSPAAEPAPGPIRGPEKGAEASSGGGEHGRI